MNAFEVRELLTALRLQTEAAQSSYVMLSATQATVDNVVRRLDKIAEILAAMVAKQQ